MEATATLPTGGAHCTVPSIKAALGQFQLGVVMHAYRPHAGCGVHASDPSMREVNGGGPRRSLDRESWRPAWVV